MLTHWRHCSLAPTHRYTNQIGIAFEIVWYMDFIFDLRSDKRYLCIVMHYRDVIMGTIASQITSLTIVYSIVYSDLDQRKHQSSASLAFVGGIHRDRWIPRTKGQLRGKCFHLMTSSCFQIFCIYCIAYLHHYFALFLEINVQQYCELWGEYCMYNPKRAW